MRLAFLGTGAGFSGERYNGAVVVDGRLLLDAGAPLLTHMNRLAIAPERIEVLFLTHFHGDHLAGLVTFLAYRAFNQLGPFTAVTPEAGEERLTLLMRAAWSGEWDKWRQSFDLRCVVAGRGGEVEGVAFETVELPHGDVSGLGYRLHLGDRVLAYAGDTEMSPALDRLVEGADVAITEATSEQRVPTHTTWEEAAELARRHPRTRFFFNHVFSGEPEGGVHDLQVVEV
jgi:ribonuclease BN (tRNA processing enzyme)